MSKLYLASGSPRRRELLGQIGVPFSPLSTVIDETPWPAEPAAVYVRRLACAKAQAGLASLAAPRAAVVLGADTSAVLDGVEDVYLGDIAEEIRGRLRENHKAVERELAR